jgi:heptosyltransferase-2
MWPDQTPKNIIVRMPNWLGDLVMATPILEDLHRKYPNAKITAMCQSNVAGLLKNDPNIHEVFNYKKPSGWIHRAQHDEIIDTLRKGEYDLGVLLTNSFSSAWWFWRGNVKNRIGFADNYRSLLLNKAPPFPKKVESQHLVVTYKELLAPLGIPLSDNPPKLYVSRAEENHAHSILEKYGISFGKSVIVGINPGAAYGSAKCWLPDRFKAVTQKLLENPVVSVVYFGDPAGAGLVNEICKGLPDRVINLAGKTNLRELLALIQSCSIILTNDSGPMHIASALNKPLLALFGSTSDVKTSPYSYGKVIHKHVECSPCYLKKCPFTHFKCMTSISVDEVYKDLEQMIEEKPSEV